MKVLAFLCVLLMSEALKGNNCSCTISKSLNNSFVQKEVQQVLRQYIYKKDRRKIEPPVFTRCPNAYVRHDDSCYIAAQDLANWADALVYCEAYGTHLAFIETAREQTFLTNYIKIFNGTSTDLNFCHWIGGTDTLLESEWFLAKAVTPVTKVFMPLRR